jgi:hypothetical protein
VDVVQDEVYEVRNQRQGSSELTASGHDKANDKCDGYGNQAPSDGFS